MNYKLINKLTGEEHICQKVTIDGFDYYVSDETPKKQCFIYDVLDKRVWKVTNEHCLNAYFEQDCKNWRIILATNNPNIDIPKVVDEVRKMAISHVVNIDDSWSLKSFEVGYNKSQETHPFSEENMIEFAKYSIKNNFCKEENRYYQYWELLQFWKQKRAKIIYYE